MKARGPQAAAWDDPTVSADFNAARFVAVPPNAFMDQTVTLELGLLDDDEAQVYRRAAVHLGDRSFISEQQNSKARGKTCRRGEISFIWWWRWRFWERSTGSCG